MPNGFSTNFSLQDFIFATHVFFFFFFLGGGGASFKTDHTKFVNPSAHNSITPACKGPSLINPAQVLLFK